MSDTTPISDGAPAEVTTTEGAPPLDHASGTRLAQQSAALEWMVVVGLIGICMTVVIVIAMRLAKPRRGKPLRTTTRLTSAWQESGKRLQVEGSHGPDEMEGLQ